MAKYYYNGVLLPEIPADVLAEYPYCWIRNDGTNSKYDLVFSDTPWYCSSLRYMYDSGSGSVPYYSIDYNGYENATEWAYAGESSDAFGINASRTVLWSNHDIPNGSATATEIYFAGSEPVAEDYTPPKTYYRISSTRLKAIADQVRRITGTEDDLTLSQMVTALMGIATGSSEG